MKGILCAVLVCGLLSAAAVADCFNPFIRYSNVTYSQPVYSNFKHAYVAPVVVQKVAVAPVYYELGVPAQFAAKQQYALRTDADYESFLQFKAFMAGAASRQIVAPGALATSGQQQYYGGTVAQAGAAGAARLSTPNPPPAPAFQQTPQQTPQQQAQQSQQPTAQQANVSPYSVMLDKCASCHGLAQQSPQGGLVLDPTVRLTGDTIIEIANRMRLPIDHPDVMPPKAKGTLQEWEKGVIFQDVLSLHEKGPTK